jgi:hypothetical protein
MSQYDHFANPIMGGWDSAPNNDAPYIAILPPREIIGKMNSSESSYAAGDPRRRLARLSSEMNWKVADAIPYKILNEILWKDAKGANSKEPELRFSNIVPEEDDEAELDGDDD